MSLFNFKVLDMVKTYYITSGYWTLMTVCSLIYLFIRVERPARKKLLLTALFSILIVLNDISYQVLIKFFDQASYYRFLWVIPYGMIVAYALMRCILDIIERSNKVKQKAYALLLLFFAISFLNITNPNYISRIKGDFPQNKYLVIDDILDIRNYLNAEREQEICGKEPVIACPKIIMMQYQTIDAGCIITTNRDVYLQIRDNGEDISTLSQERMDRYLLSTICEDNAQPDLIEVREAIEREKIDYMIVRAYAGMEDYMEKLDFTLVGQSYSFLVYRNMKL